MADPIKVKLNNLSSELSNKTNLIRLCSKLNIKVTKFIEIKNGYLLICSSVEDAEKLFEKNTLATLKQINLLPLLPSELKTKQTILLKNVDRFLLQKTFNEIKCELTTKNDGIDIVDGVILKNSIKLTFSNSKIVAKCERLGLNAFGIHIPGYNITRENFVKIEYCYACFEIENHVSKNCPRKLENPNFKVCSKCASTDHTYAMCKAEPERFVCINCGQNHHTLAFKCQARKNAIKMKSSGTPKYTDYSAAVKTSLTKKMLDKSETEFSPNKIMTCMCAALLNEYENPGNFNTQLNILLKQNNLPGVDLSGFKPPDLINALISALAETEHSSQQMPSQNTNPQDSSANIRSHDIPSLLRYYKENANVQTSQSESKQITSSKSGGTTLINVSTTSSQAEPENARKPPLLTMPRSPKSTENPVPNSSKTPVTPNPVPNSSKTPVTPNPIVSKTPVTPNPIVSTRNSITGIPKYPGNSTPNSSKSQVKTNPNVSKSPVKSDQIVPNSLSNSNTSFSTSPVKSPVNFKENSKALAKLTATNTCSTEGGDRNIPEATLIPTHHNVSSEYFSCEETVKPDKLSWDNFRACRIGKTRVKDDKFIEMCVNNEIIVLDKDDKILPIEIIRNLFNMNGKPHIESLTESEFKNKLSSAS